LNILIVSLRGPTNEERRGGAQDYVQYIAAPWIDQGHEVTILCSQELLDNKLLPDVEVVSGINITRVGTPKHRILPLLKKTREMVTDVDIVIENLMGFPLFLPIFLEQSKSIIAIKHHFEGKSFITSQGLIKGYIGRFLEEIMQPLIYRRTPFVVVSRKTLAEMNNKWVKPKADVVIIPPGIAPLKLNPDAKKYSDPTVIYYGALDTGRKKVDHLITAFKLVLEEIPSARLVIGGQGPDGKMLKKMAESMPVEFLGFLSEESKCELLEKGWLFSSPSMTEGFGITWIEANSAGLPVVAYDLNLDTIDESCARAVEKGNINQLASAIIELLSNDELRRMMMHSARLNAKRFDWNRSSEALLEFINKVNSNVHV